MSDACVIGQGFAGLSTAFVLAKSGMKVSVLGPKSNKLTASTAAHGICTVKGLLESSQPLFELKMLGHNTLMAFIREVELASGSEIPKIIEGVWEPFWSPENFRLERGRTYKERFTGAFDVLNYYAHFPTSSGLGHSSESLFALSRYPGDFWIDTDAYLASLRKACVNVGVHFSIEEEVAHSELRDGLWYCMTSKGERASAKYVIFCMGASTAQMPLMESYGGKLWAAGGWTYRGFGSPAADTEIAWVKETAGAVLFRGVYHIGSTTDEQRLKLSELKSGPEISKIVCDDHSLALDHLKRKIGPDFFKFWNDALAQSRWGMRVRTRDRTPIVGPLDNTKHPGAMVNTGYYKSGLTLSPLGAQYIRDVILGRETDAFPKIVDPRRLVAD